MIRSLLILLLIVPALQSRGQDATLFNRSFGFSYETDITEVVATPDGGWLFCGHDQTCDIAFVSQIDSTGNYIYTYYPAIPGYSYSEAYSITSWDDSSYVVAGLCRFADDVGSDWGFVTKVSGENQLWTKVFHPVFNDVRINSNFEILLFSFQEILVLNDAGDSINSIPTSSYKYDEILPSNNILLANDNDVFIIDSAGVQIAITSFSNILAIATVGTDQVAVLADDKLQLLDYDLDPIASSATLGNFVQASLLKDTGGFWIEARDANSNCSLLCLTDSLTLIYDVNLPVSSNDYSRNFFGLGKHDSLIVVIGTENYNLSSCAALKTFKSYSGETSALTTNATLLSNTWDYLGYTVDTINYTFFITNYEFGYHLQIQNSGPDTIHTITVNGNLPGGVNCAPVYFYLPLTNLSIAPNEMFEYSFPVNISIGGPFSPMPFFNFNGCVWLSSPNNNLDADLADNYSCNIVTGLESPDIKRDIVIFPNPADDIVQVNLASEETFTLEINNAAGIVFFREVIKGNTSVDVSKYPSGYYIAALSNKNAKLFKSLIIR